jgi:translation initiation factor 3 subunit C
MTISAYVQPILADMFELEVNSVHALVSKMIINEELMASLDQPSQCIVMHRSGSLS